MSKRRNADSDFEASRRRDTGSWTQVVKRHHDPEQTQELATSIVGAIAAARGVAITEVTSPPLYECVDTAALETTLFGQGMDGGSGHGDGAVEFRYAEFLVAVNSDGWVQVYESVDSD